eukprot:5797441-Pleurochrysis_carterae.AAC.1
MARRQADAEEMENLRNELIIQENEERIIQKEKEKMERAVQQRLDVALANECAARARMRARAFCLRDAFANSPLHARPQTPSQTPFDHSHTPRLFTPSLLPQRALA